MTRLSWGAAGTRRYETGVDRGVLYPPTGAGVAWPGLISVTESPDGGAAKTVYLDGVAIQNRSAPEQFAGTLEAYSYPREFARCDGTRQLARGLSASHQRRQSFGLTYRTRIGTDLNSDAGYKIHLIYNALAAPSERQNQTLSDNPEATVFSWGITAKPVRISGARATAHFVIDSTEAKETALASLENILYGSAISSPYLPSPSDIATLFANAEFEGPDIPFTVEDLGNGLFRISGPDAVVQMVDGFRFQLSTPLVTDNSNGTYTATSG